MTFKKIGKDQEVVLRQEPVLRQGENSPHGSCRWWLGVVLGRELYLSSILTKNQPPLFQIKPESG